VSDGFVPAQADAVVAVLLLVPGLLLARLDLPGTKSVLGQLHKFQRMLAAASVVVTTALAIVVATVESDHAMTMLFQTALAVLIVILFCCLCEFYARRIHRGSVVPRSARVPRWLRDACRSTRRTVEPDDFFDARGEV
jgi:O-antigen/teichoic acid export membrane protein